jgi:hypothetical protein
MFSVKKIICYCSFDYHEQVGCNKLQRKKLWCTAPQTVHELLLTPNHFKSCCVVTDNSLAGDEEGEQAAAKSAHGMWAAEQSCSHRWASSTVLNSAQALQCRGPLRPELERPCPPRPPPRCPRRGPRRASSTSGRTAPKAEQGRATESHSKTDSYCSVWAPLSRFEDRSRRRQLPE